MTQNWDVCGVVVSRLLHAMAVDAEQAVLIHTVRLSRKVVFYIRSGLAVINLI